MSAMMKGGKNSLSTYRANILIFFACPMDVQVNVPQQLQALLQTEIVVEFYGLIRAKQLSLFISCFVAENLHFFFNFNLKFCFRDVIISL